MDISALIKQYDFNLKYAEALVADLDENQMTTTPTQGLVNHPAFTIGHLITGSFLLLKRLGKASELPEGWDELFRRNGPGDLRLPDSDIQKYPPKESLIRVLTEQHEQVKTCLVRLSEEELNEPAKWRFNNYMPGLIDLIVFLCINHEAMHLGQLAAWRREMNLPSALSTM